MSTKDIAEEFARAWQNAVVNGDIPPWKAMFDQDFVSHVGKGIGLDARMRHVIDLHGQSQVIGVEIEYVTSDRYLFALDFSGHFRLTSDMPGHPGTAGKEIKSHALCLFRVKRGKIIEEWGKTTVTGLE